MADTINELAPELAQIRAFLEEAQAELLGKIEAQLAQITALEEALGGAGALPQDAKDHLAAIRGLSEGMASVIQTPPPPVEEPVEA